MMLRAKENLHILMRGAVVVSSNPARGFSVRFQSLVTMTVRFPTEGP